MISTGVPQKVESNHVTVTIDLTMVESKLKRNLPYKKEKSGVIEIKKNDYKGDNGKNEKYLANLSLKDQFSYVGTLNENLKRNGIGIYKYKLGDTYFGHWKDDKRHQLGVYAHKPENEQSDFYVGEWEEATRSGFGIYVWKKDNQPKEKEIMDIFIGNFSLGNLSRGLYISRKSEGDKISRFYYFGKFENAVKRDENCFYYFTSSDILFQGHIEDEDFIKGKIYQGDKSRAFSFEKGQDEKEYLPDEVTEEEERDLKGLHQIFKNFDENLNVKEKFTLLIEKIEELFKRYSELSNFNEIIDLFNELKIADYQNIFPELFKVTGDLGGFMLKAQEANSKSQNSSTEKLSNSAKKRLQRKQSKMAYNINE